MSIHSPSELGLIVTSARRLLRTQAFATLATLEATSNHPYASLIAVATAIDGTPVFLISTLAWHTRNLEADPRASILLASQANSNDDPLNMGRISVMGTAKRASDPSLRRRFLARHPSAVSYVDFSDFSFWRLDVEQAHFVGGFGRISTLSANEILLDREAVSLWNANADAATERLNKDRSELIERLAASAGGQASQNWRVAACDPDGCDLVAGEHAVRLTFKNPIDHPDELDESLQALGPSR